MDVSFMDIWLPPDPTGRMEITPQSWFQLEAKGRLLFFLLVCYWLLPPWGGEQLRNYLQKRCLLAYSPERDSWDINSWHLEQMGQRVAVAVEGTWWEAHKVHYSLTPTYYREGNWGPEKVNDLLKVTQLSSWAWGIIVNMAHIFIHRSSKPQIPWWKLVFVLSQQSLPTAELQGMRQDISL